MQSMMSRPQIAWTGLPIRYRLATGSHQHLPCESYILVEAVPVHPRVPERQIPLKLPPSYLCIYEKVGENLETNIPNPSTGYVTRTGATLVAKNAANTIRVFYKTYGTWAVTAP